MFSKKAALEAWKFTVYLVAPVGTVALITDPLNMRSLLEQKQYIVYPPEGPRPPRNREEARIMYKELQAQKSHEQSSS